MFFLMIMIGLIGNQNILESRTIHSIIKCAILSLIKLENYLITCLLITRKEINLL